MILGVDRRVWRFNLSVGATLLGPIEEGFDAFMVHSGQSANLWLVADPIAADGFATVPPTMTELDAWAVGFRLARANVFTPARVRDRWWILKTSAIVPLPPNNRLRLLTFRDPELPATR